MRKKSRMILAGDVISEGLAEGEAFVYKDILSRKLYSYEIDNSEIGEELDRVKGAISLVLSDLEKTKNIVRADIGSDHANIIQAHKEILKDKRLLEDLKTELNAELVNAEHAVKKIFRKWENKFAASDNEMIRSKAGDMRDLSRRVLKALLGYEKNIFERMPPGSILVSKRLLPSDTVHLKRQNLNGVIVAQGSANSHSAILARALGIPAVANVNIGAGVLNSGDDVLIDGRKGEVILRPDKADVSCFRRRLRRVKQDYYADRKRARRRAKTKDGESVAVEANASSVDDFKAAVDNGCDGIGLFRIEQLYLASKIMPGEKFLLQRFTRILNNASGKDVCVRLLDIGGDKRLPYLDVEEEADSALGLRGIRLLLRHKQLLRTQVKILVKLSQNFKIRLLVPFVTLDSDIRQVKEIKEECASLLPEHRKKCSLKVGAMVEVPAAVENIRKICENSDFLSIGTNDLIQYTMAAGRENYSVSDYYEKGVDFAFGMIKRIIRASKRAGIECGICGEIAGDPMYTARLLKAGIRRFSVSPHRIPRLKEKIRGLCCVNP